MNGKDDVKTSLRSLSSVTRKWISTGEGERDLFGSHVSSHRNKMPQRRVKIVIAELLVNEFFQSVHRYVHNTQATRWDDESQTEKRSCRLGPPGVGMSHRLGIFRRRCPPCLLSWLCQRPQPRLGNGRSDHPSRRHRREKEEPDPITQRLSETLLRQGYDPDSQRFRKILANRRSWVAQRQKENYERRKLLRKLKKSVDIHYRKFVPNSNAEGAATGRWVGQLVEKMVDSREVDGGSNGMEVGFVLVFIS